MGDTNVFNFQSAVLKPGDKVLVALTEDRTDDDIVLMRRVLHEQFPDVLFVVVEGANIVVDDAPLMQEGLEP